MKLIRKQPGDRADNSFAVGQTINRRTFLHRSGLAAGAGAAAVLAPQRGEKSTRRKRAGEW